MNNSGIVLIVLCVIGLIIGGMFGLPVYNVWSQEQSGKAALAKATEDRQVSVLEAKAKEESATHLANAEIERAKGVAEANKIIGDSLKNNEAYLRWLWIDGTSNAKSQIIYVPTEANIPIMESGRTPIQVN